jgi:dipeptidyl aminopeptidase/acylaminoacyl peptidase
MTLPTPSTLRDSYRMAMGLAFGQREAKLIRGAVRPVWAADGSHFWHATREAQGLRHVLVDVKARAQSDLFDHADVAAALALATGQEVTVGQLALEQVSFDSATDSVHFVAQATRWRWNRSSARLESLGEAFGAKELSSPDGSVAVCLDGPNLRLREPGQLASHALTEDGEPDWGWGDFTDFTSQVHFRLHPEGLKPSALWSSDSQTLAVLRVDRRHLPRNHLVQSVPAEGVRPRLHSYPYPTPQDADGAKVELWFLRRDGSRVRAQIEGLACRSITAFAMMEARWSADGNSFYYQESSRDFKRLALWRVDPGSGAAVVVHQEADACPVTMASGAPEPAIFHPLSDGRTICWSERSGWGHLYLVGPGGEPRAITQGAWLVRGILHVDEAAQRIVFWASGVDPAADPYCCAAYSVSFDGSGLRPLSPEPGLHVFILAQPGGDGAGSMAPDGACFVDTWSTPVEPPISVLRDSGTGALLMALQTADAADSWPAAMPLPEAFSVPAPDAGALGGSDTLWGAIYKPPGFDPAQRYPVIDLIYGGVQTAVVAKGWGNSFHSATAEQLAALGFVVVMVDGRGTAYRSRAFQLASYGKVESCAGLSDHVHATRAIAASRPWMDLDRMGIAGGSGGGYATVRALGEYPEFYKVGVAVCGNHDQRGYTAGWSDRYQGLFDPQDEALFTAQDNTTLAARIHGQLLLIHGEMDDNVHPGLTLRVVDALIKADRNFDLLIVPNAGHGVIAGSSIQRRLFDYFVEHLMGEKPPRPGASP